MVWLYDIQIEMLRCMSSWCDYVKICSKKSQPDTVENVQIDHTYNVISFLVVLNKIGGI